MKRDSEGEVKEEGSPKKNKTEDEKKSEENNSSHKREEGKQEEAKKDEIKQENTNENNDISLLSLPVPIISRIITENLPIDNLGKVASCCKLFHHLAFVFFSEKVTSDNFKGIDDKKMFKFIATYYPKFVVVKKETE